MHAGRSVVVGFVSGVLLCVSAAHAGEAVVKARQTVVRSAPFEIAPELARLRAGEKLPADDRPQGAWRRVQLPDGRFGLVHDADVDVTVPPPPPQPVTPAPPTTTPPRPSTTPPPPRGDALPPRGYPPRPGYPPPPGYSPPPPGYGPYGYPPPGYFYVPPPGFHTHDGAYVRLHFGFGYTSIRGQALGETLKLSGMSTSFGVAVGGAIAPNVIVYGALTLTTISNPSAEINGDAGTILPNFNATAGSLGAGVAYSFQPENLYVAGTLLATQLTLEDTTDNSKASTDLGFGFEGLFGKEWWVSDNWGLGVAGQFLFAWMKDRPVPPGFPFPSGTWTVASVGLLFSATYN